MQESNGALRMLNKEEAASLTPINTFKTVHIGQIFKIQHCYFKITDLSADGIVASGISRKEYFDSKR